MWKIYDAVVKATKQEVSIFLVRQQDLEAQFGKHAPLFIESLRHESTILSKLRHPNILGIQQALIETGKEYALVTEPIFASLSNIKGDYSNISHPKDEKGSSIACVPEELKSTQLDPIEIKYGISQIVEALSFCHTSTGLTHANVCPNNIYITQSGDWKLCGFNFSFYKDTRKVYFSGNNLGKNTFYPNLDYAAPEYVLNNNPVFNSDVFSITLIYYYLLTNQKVLSCDNNMDTYKNTIKYINNLSLEGFQQNIQESIKEGLDLKENRIDIQRLLVSHLFGEVPVRALRFLIELDTKDPVKKAQFLKSLTKIIKDFPEKLLFQKVLPPLLKEVIDLKQTVFALENIMIIVEKMKQRQFINQVLPVISKCFQIDEPFQIRLLLISRFQLLLEKTTQVEQKNYLIPFLIKCLDSTNAEIQIESLKKAEDCVNNQLIEYLQFKTQLLPKIDKICRNTQLPSVRVNSIICLGRVSSILDRDTLAQVVVPILEYCIQMDQSATTLMSIIGVFHRISKQFDVNYIAVKILPILLPLAVQKSLNFEQFQKYMKSIKTMMDVVEDSRLKEFNQQKQLDQVKKEENDIKQILHDEYKENNQKTPIVQTQLPPLPKQNYEDLEPKKQSNDVPSLDDLLEKNKQVKPQPSFDDLLEKNISSFREEPKKSIPSFREEPKKNNQPSFDDLLEKNISSFREEPKKSDLLTSFKEEPKKTLTEPKKNTLSSFDDLLEKNISPLPSFREEPKILTPIVEPKKSIQPSFDDLLEKSFKEETKKIVNTPVNESKKNILSSFEKTQTPKPFVTSEENWNLKKEPPLNFDDLLGNNNNTNNQAFKGFEDEDDFSNWSQPKKENNQTLDFDSMMKNFQ